LYDYFYKGYAEGTLEDYKAFIPALPTDNPHLPESYIDELRKLPEESRKRLLEGNWDYSDDIDTLFSFNDISSCFDNPMGEGKKYITADIASYGDDRTVILVWDGFNIVSKSILKHQSIPTIADKIKALKTEYNVPLKNVIVDADGLGIGVKDILKCEGFKAASKPLNGGNYNNLKSQCYFLLADYVREGLINFGSLDKEELAKELMAHKIKDVDKDGKNQVVPKEQIKRAIGKSPDISDSVMFRMWFELKPKSEWVIMGQR
jgi:hypothetical protein